MISGGREQPSDLPGFERVLVRTPRGHHYCARGGRRRQGRRDRALVGRADGAVIERELVRVGGAPGEEVPHVQAAGAHCPGVPQTSSDRRVVLACCGLRGVEHHEVQWGSAAWQVAGEVVAVPAVGRQQRRVSLSTGAGSGVTV